MAVRTGYSDATNREPFAELDLTHGGDSYVVRVTAIPPYRTATPGELVCHIDYMNVTQGTQGRYENVTLPPIGPADNRQRRFTMIRHFQANRGRGVSVPSPVFPGRRP